MVNYNLPDRKIPVMGKYQLIVVGGGTAGSFAAIAAAENGIDTLLIERLGFLGGSSTGAQVTPMMHVKIPGNPASSYLDREIRETMIREGTAAIDKSGNNGWFSPQNLKLILENRFIKAGGTIRYDTEFIEPVLEKQQIKGVVVHNKSGFQVYLADIVIDGTGDADVAYNAGAPCSEGREDDGKNQSVSLRFMLGNIDISKFQRFLAEIGQEAGLEYPLVETAMVWNRGYPLEKLFRKGVLDRILKEEDGNYFQTFSVPGMPGVMSFNCPEIPDMNNSLHIEKLTQARIKGREMVCRLYNFMKVYFSGFENSYILEIASMLGVRESRRIKGEYILSIEDYNQRSRFDDAIARTAYPVDVHGLNEENFRVNHLKEGDFFEIPYRALLPRKIKGLLVIGRSISSTFIVQSSIRIQPICRATGEAAGLAASLAIKKDIIPGKLDGSLVRKKMIMSGAELKY